MFGAEIAMFMLMVGVPLGLLACLWEFVAELFGLHDDDDPPPPTGV